MILEEKLTKQIIGAAIEVHRHLDPDLLESARLWISDGYCEGIKRLVF